MKHILLIVLFANQISCNGQAVSDSLTLLFMGDIMGHDSQIRSARTEDSTVFDYNSCFTHIKSELISADLAIANLEVTLAGPPYKGYPQFSSPDALAVACKNAGIDVLVTANNHCLDRGKAGLIRTINVLDSLEIRHTGTFKNSTDKQKNGSLFIKTGNFNIALIGFTYGTNGIPVPKDVFVNINQKDSLKREIAIAKAGNPDVVILFIHWGTEYEKEPNAGQIALADSCFAYGVDIIIGSHPHVIQKSICDTINNRNRFVTYSLGNFISNQKTQGTDGGQMMRLVLTKDSISTKVTRANYILTWVYGPLSNGRKKFYILPCSRFEDNPDFFQDSSYFQKMNMFINDSRSILDAQNVNVEELK